MPPGPPAHSDADATTDPAADPELRRERAHLARSREFLLHMRTAVAGLSAQGGDRVSTEHLKATLWRRMRSLEDDPSVPLFFGRLDLDTAAGAERLYVGRRHVTDDAGEPMVLDWRAGVSRSFYRASAREPMGVVQRRRFGFSAGALTVYEDEQLSAGHQTRDSALLAAEIERPRLGPMRDIVATIQPEQDEIVRADLATTVCVQGAPGTGKTAVGLHRAAWLLYAHREQLSRQGVLVVGPNASFLRYIGDVLPALGEIDATQSTVAQLCDRVPVRHSDPPERGRLVGDARLAEVARRAVWSQLRAPTEALVVPRGSRRWRVPLYDAEAIVNELRSRGIRYSAGAALLPRRLAHAVLVRMETAGESPDDRIQDAVARSRPVREWCQRVWPAVDPVRTTFALLSHRAFLAECADGVLSEAEQRVLAWPSTPRGPGSAPWSLGDAVLVDEVADLVERQPSRGHVVLDEAQDLSPMMLRAVGRRCSTGSATVLGDLAQATTAWAATSWPVALGHLGKADAMVEELTRGFRVPADVIAFAARLLPVAAPGLAPPSSVRRGTGDLDVRRCDVPIASAAAAAQQLLTREGSVGVVVPDAAVGPVADVLVAAGVAHSVLGSDAGDDAFEVRVDVVPATLAKGLEFDHVVLVEPADIVAGEPEPVVGVRRLYVCLTRAVTSLTVLHARPLPDLLTS
ncbi:MAG: AAA family ATPase [Nocardioidaceae bacterium]|nr:AAA family ATPase [Nocardioidaceae bacterium]